MKQKEYIQQIKKYCWDCDYKNPSPATIISRAINFGGFDFIEEIIKRYGKNKFLYILKNKKGLNRVAVNYWCLIYDIDTKDTTTFQQKIIWDPFQ